MADSGNTKSKIPDEFTVESGPIFVTTNSGLTWTPTDAPEGGWTSVACSADGRQMAASSAYPSGIWLSSDFGQNWSQTSTPTDDYWELGAVGSSTDGSQLSAIAYSHWLFTSTNNGTTWASNSFPSLLPQSSLATTLACSAVGRTVFVGTENSAIYVTTNAGVGWTQMISPTVFWSAFAQSADGTKMVAAADDDLVYTLQPGPTLNITPVGTDLQFSWPGYMTNFVLQQSSDLGPSNWIASALAPQSTNNLNQVTLTPGSGQVFFRLRSQ